MYSVTVRNHILIAHSLPGEVFGPAQRMHGATYVIDATFSSPDLDENNIVIDIGKASDILAEISGNLTHRNLDDMAEFEGCLTTTEFLAAYLHRQISDRITGDFAGTLKVTLGESHVASASYEAAVA